MPTDSTRAEVFETAAKGSFLIGKRQPSPLLPEPFADEAFGSWLRRCAVSHRHATVHDFAASLLCSEGGEPPPQQCDWDCEPPPALLKILAARAKIPLASVCQLVVTKQLNILRSHERDAYCPICFSEDIETRAVYRRRAWLDAWTLTCAKHSCLLGSYEHVAHAKSRLAASRALTANDQLRLGMTTLGHVTGFSPPSPWWAQPHALSRGARVAELARGRWLDPAMCRSELGRNLVLLAGSHKAGRLYSELFMENRRDFFCWKDERGNFLNWPRVRFPLASIRVRLTAAYVAAALWRHIDPRQLPSMSYDRDALRELLRLSRRRYVDDEWPIFFSDGRSTT